uniref:Uncharacterized protein n=1 Tax=Chromera velia CCMP2878 TaxID=1169474 RepID=A0A0G4I4M5_9ALVE|eukprot:Cvel_10915.t1-p1 / transcript=Cvel_10915.t1 / gene=Cvel_10915 / organism=Chromera_velia_CCMP2878 / gene_product=hypothetical protein / transcript_product=hypothetical protein / location=Cvel_scaffold670:48486-49061(+) / protein_length=192 / sequence_SO=supercontig / SO=protein_coding / is_pseudo=false
MFLSGNHKVLPGVSRFTQTVHIWTVGLSWVFLLLLFFGALNESTPNPSLSGDSSANAIEILRAIVSSFSASSLLGVLFVYALTIPVRVLTDFLFKPRTPEVRELKDIAALAKRGHRVTLEQANLLWTSSILSRRRRVCWGRGDSHTRSMVSVGLSLLPPGWQHGEAVARLVRWRQKRAWRGREAATGGDERR